MSHYKTFRMVVRLEIYHEAQNLFFKKKHPPQKILSDTDSIKAQSAEEKYKTM